MKTTYLALGSNLDQPEKKVRAAIYGLRALGETRASKLYVTEPVSPIPQPNFINAVVELKTELSLKSLWERVQRLEQQLGKVPKPKEAPRPIDIDLLTYDSKCFSDPVTIPHPRMFERDFVLIPLLDLTSTVTVEGVVVEIQGILNGHYHEKLVCFSAGYDSVEEQSCLPRESSVCTHLASALPIGWPNP